MPPKKKIKLATYLFVLIFSLIILYLVNKNIVYRQNLQKRAFQEGFSFDFEAPNNYPNWEITSGSVQYEYSPFLGSNALKISNGTDIAYPIQINPDTPITELEIKFYDNLDLQEGFIFAIFQDDSNSLAGGINTEVSANEYIYRQNQNGTDKYLKTGIQRTRGVHQIKLRITQKGSYMLIDGVNLSFIPRAGQQSVSGINKNLIQPTKVILRMPWPELGDFNFLDDFSMQPSPYNQLLSENSGNIEKHYSTLLLSQYPQVYDLAMSSPDQLGYRAVAQTALAFAFRARLNNIPCSQDKYTNTNDCDKARSIYRKLANERSNWRARWLSGATDSSITTGSWLVWDFLDAETQDWILNILNWEADFYTERLSLIKNTPNEIDPLYNIEGSRLKGCTYKQGFSRYLADTSAEDNGTSAMFLGIYSQMLKNFPTKFSDQSAKFEKSARTYAFHILSDNEVDSLYGISSKTFNPLGGSSLLENHYFRPSLHYSDVLTVSSNILPFYQKVNPSTPLPTEYTHNFARLWKDLIAYIDPVNFLWRIPVSGSICQYQPYDICTGSLGPCTVTNTDIYSYSGKDEWGGDITWHNNAIAAAPTLINDDGVKYNDLLKHELFFQPDYLAFPQNDNLTLYKPDGSAQDVSYEYFKDINYFTYITMQNLGLTERHIIAFLIQNSSWIPSSSSKSSPTPIPQVSLNFQIKFQGIGNQVANKNVSVVLKQNGVEKYRFDSVSVAANSVGVFSGTVSNITPGVYDVYIKGWAHLQKSFGNVTINSNMPTQDWSGFQLKAGDIAGSGDAPDNMIDASDLGKLISIFNPLGSVPSGTVADLNSDGRIDSSDLGFLISNFHPGIYGD